MAIEEIKYATIEKSDNLEIRRYESHIVAETFVEGKFEEVGSEGFRRLADYIDGKNRKKHSIAMTAPVTQEKGSQKIAMTAPVGQEKSRDKWRITFTMPAEYTLENLPEPLDSRIRLKTEPARLMAAIRYSGTWRRSGYDKNLAKLRAWIADRGYRPVGEPVWARYNPPFMPWFLRRNEILIPVEKM
jgi:effector-binding domain-containing protein